jgi:hypothetical protein
MIDWATCLHAEIQAVCANLLLQIINEKQSKAKTQKTKKFQIKASEDLHKSCIINYEL